MDDYKKIEVEIARKYNAKAKGSKKSIGDFLLQGDAKQPVNVKSNNLDKKNYSPNIVSAMKLLKWLQKDGHELYFIFVDYKKINKDIKIVKQSKLIPVHHLDWSCLTIEAQGWGVIQMSKQLKINPKQTKKEFFKGMRKAYEIYMSKETKKMQKIAEMIKTF